MITKKRIQDTLAAFQPIYVGELHQVPFELAKATSTSAGEPKKTACLTYNFSSRTFAVQVNGNKTETGSADVAAAVFNAGFRTIFECQGD